VISYEQVETSKSCLIRCVALQSAGDAAGNGICSRCLIGMTGKLLACGILLEADHWRIRGWRRVVRLMPTWRDGSRAASACTIRYDDVEGDVISSVAGTGIRCRLTVTWFHYWYFLWYRVFILFLIHYWLLLISSLFWYSISFVWYYWWLTLLILTVRDASDHLVWYILCCLISTCILETTPYFCYSLTCAVMFDTFVFHFVSGRALLFVDIDILFILFCIRWTFIRYFIWYIWCPSLLFLPVYDVHSVTVVSVHLEILLHCHCHCWCKHFLEYLHLHSFSVDTDAISTKWGIWYSEYLRSVTILSDVPIYHSFLLLLIPFIHCVATFATFCYYSLPQFCHYAVDALSFCWPFCCHCCSLLMVIYYSHYVRCVRYLLVTFNIVCSTLYYIVH